MAPLSPILFVPGAKKEQTIVFAVGEACMMTLVTGLYLFRIHTLQLHRLSGAGLSFSRVLLNLVYLFGFLFTISTFVPTLVSGMRNDGLCDAAIYLCLVFYLGGKVLLYVFMCERLRAIRQVVVDRCADILWQRCFWGVLIVFGQIAIVCVFYPLDAMNDSYCTIGLPTFITTPILIFDISCNLVISGLFYKQSRAMFNGVTNALIPPNIKRFFHRQVANVNGTRAFAMSKALEDIPETDNATLMIAEITRKTLIASILILFSTIVNLVLLIHYNDSEHGWLCFLTCSIDITWNIACLTYLIGLPTSHESPDEQAFAARSLGFALSSSSFHPRSNPPISDCNLFTARYPETAPAYRAKPTPSLATWACAGASASGFCGGPQMFMMEDLATGGGPGPALRRNSEAEEWCYEGC